MPVLLEELVPVPVLLAVPEPVLVVVGDEDELRVEVPDGELVLVWLGVPVMLAVSEGVFVGDEVRDGEGVWLAVRLLEIVGVLVALGVMLGVELDVDVVEAV